MLWIVFYSSIKIDGISFSISKLQIQPNFFIPYRKVLSQKINEGNYASLCSQKKKFP